MSASQSRDTHGTNNGGANDGPVSRGVLASCARWVAQPGTGIFLLGVALAFGVLGASEKLGRALSTMKQDNVIRVKGVAGIDLVSDQGSWTGSVSGRALTLGDADAQRESSLNALRKYVLSKGFQESDLSMGRVSISKDYKRDDKGYSTSTLEAYDLSQSVTVRSTKLELLETLSNEVTGALVKEGFEVSSRDVNYTVSKIEAAKLQLLEQATANAYERAQTLARGSGSSVGALVSASQGVFQIVARGEDASSDQGISDTDSIEKTGRIVVTLEFAIR